MTKLAILFALGCMASSVPAAEEAVSGDGVPLSNSGMRRIQRNITILEQNLKDAQTNIELTDKNIGTIESELQALLALEAEHNELKRKFSDYLSDTGKQLQKNDKELERVTAYEREFDATMKRVQSTKTALPKEAQEKYRSQVEKARSDKAELQRFKEESDTNTQRVTILLRELNDSLNQVQARKTQLSSQVKSWQQRRKEFQQLMAEYRTKKANIEKVIAEHNE